MDGRARGHGAGSPRWGELYSTACAVPAPLPPVRQPRVHSWPHRAAPQGVGTAPPRGPALPAAPGLTPRLPQPHPVCGRDLHGLRPPWSHHTANVVVRQSPAPAVSARGVSGLGALSAGVNPSSSLPPSSRPVGHPTTGAKDSHTTALTQATPGQQHFILVADAAGSCRGGAGSGAAGVEGCRGSSAPGQGAPAPHVCRQQHATRGE